MQNDLIKELGTNFIEYAVAVNTDRALPDARSGLKPVATRILYGAYDGGRVSSKPHVKCARIVGDVMGNLHPHGDSSIYGALVRLAQPWVLRYPLIDFHGNMGNIDGDGPAAARYTEARLSKISEMGLLTGLKKNCVDFIPNYDETSEEPVLSNINLSIKSGETIGILGGTGSSKSTLISLIPRLYDVTMGKVSVGGIDVKEYDVKALREAVSVVLQKNVLFSGTIKENLKWGNENATDKEIEHVCKLACADEFIQRFPNKYDTYIEQGGTNVSGGQKQRLCIARALLKKPKILILDDSTSAVDTKTDAMIRKAFKEEIPNTTKIIIAQRVASVMDADKIVILEGGKILATGTHKELLKSCEVYKEIYTSQTNKGGKK